MAFNMTTDMCFALSRIILLAMFLYAIVILTLAGTQIINWLRFVQYLSYVKLVVTLIKYVPQAFMNYK